MKGVDFIFFDLDDTLYPAEAAYAVGLRAAYKVYGRLEKIPFNRFMQIYREARDSVKRTLGAVPAARNRQLYFKAMTGSPRLALDLMRAYDGCWPQVDARAGARIARRLSRRFPLGLITNQVAAMQLQKIKRIDPRGRYFKVIVTSEEAGAEKPDPKIFRLACRRAGVRPGRALMVGDSWEADILGAKKAGLRPVYLSPSKPSRLKSVPRIRSLSELETLL